MSDKKKYYSVNEELNDYKKETADLKKDLATAKQRIEWLSNRAYRIKPTDDNDGELWSNFACDNDMTRLARIEDLEKELGEIKERSAKLLEALNIRSERSLDVGKLEEIILIQKAQYDLEFENARGWRESLIPLEKRIATAIASGDVWEEGK